jgi:polygalacturonase
MKRSSGRAETKSSIAGAIPLLFKEGCPRQRTGWLRKTRRHHILFEITNHRAGGERDLFIEAQPPLLGKEGSGGALALAMSVLLLISLPARAQDTRTVTEPKIPEVCTTLDARLTSDLDETKPDTNRIQDALDHCAAGHAVKLTRSGRNDAFLSGPLQLKSGVTLLVDANATLFGSRDPRDYDVSRGSCGVVNNSGRGCKPLIGGDHLEGAAVMGDGTIDGRGGATLIGQQVSWWDLAQEAKVKNASQNCPRILVITASKNFTLYRVTLKNSPNFHVVFNGDGFTAWGVTIDSPRTARNTDGIDPSNATNVTITRSFIHSGDDNVAIKAGSAGPSSHITISHNHFYNGHGISIGSETDGGASAIRVTDLSIDGADNGIRIKSNASRGGLVHDVVYEDVCMRFTKNPILMDTHYTPLGQGRNKLPVYEDIVLRNIRILGSGKVTLDGYDDAHRLGMVLDNVSALTPEDLKITASHARITEGPGPVNIRIAGEDVHVDKRTEKGTANACADKFVPMPKGGR